MPESFNPDYFIDDTLKVTEGKITDDMDGKPVIDVLPSLMGMDGAVADQTHIAANMALDVEITTDQVFTPVKSFVVAHQDDLYVAHFSTFFDDFDVDTTSSYRVVFKQVKAECVSEVTNMHKQSLKRLDERRIAFEKQALPAWLNTAVDVLPKSAQRSVRSGLVRAGRAVDRYINC